MGCGLALVLGCGGQVLAAELSGSVKSVAGEPIAGALVTLTRGDGLFAETVYADAQGRYAHPADSRARRLVPMSVAR